MDKQPRFKSGFLLCPFCGSDWTSVEAVDGYTAPKDGQVNYYFRNYKHDETSTHNVTHESRLKGEQTIGVLGRCLPCGGTFDIRFSQKDGRTVVSVLIFGWPI